MPPTQQQPAQKTPSNSQPADNVANNTMATPEYPEGRPTSPHSRRFTKRPLLITLGIIIVLGISGGVTVFVLSHITKPAEESKTPQQRAADLAKQANDAATASANVGKTDEALAHYREALVQFQKAGDKAGEEGVKLQIQYYEKVRANEEKAKTSATPTTSSSDLP
jgi:flagellar basal body-associated protein FliL